LASPVSAKASVNRGWDEIRLEETGEVDLVPG